MKETKVKSLGLTLVVLTPATPEEYDLNAKKQGACVEDSVSNTIYRAWLPKFRSKFCEAVEAETKVVRKYITKELKEKNQDGTPKTTDVWDETEGKYIDRVLAETGKAITDFSDIANRIASEITFDASEKEPAESKPKKPKKVLLEKAEAVVKAGKGDVLAAKLAKNLGHPVNSDAESLAFAIDEDMQRIAAIQEQKMFGNLGIEA